MEKRNYFWIIFSLMLLCAHLNTIVIFHVDGYDRDYDEGRQLKLIKATMKNYVYDSVKHNGFAEQNSQFFLVF